MMNAIMKPAVGLPLILLLSGCTTPDIVVVDDAGAPVKDAIITGQSLSTGGQKSTTDDKGCASIPSAVQPTKWISVEKVGYETVSLIDVNQAKPIKVVLKKK